MFCLSKSLVVRTIGFTQVYELNMDVVNAYARAKMRGYLRMDGVVKSIQEPYKRFYVEIQPCIGKWRHLSIRLDNYMNSIYVEGSTGVLRALISELKKGQIEKKPMLFWYTEFRKKRETDAERSCREYDKKCSTKGYLYYDDWTWTTAYMLFIPDVEPPKTLENKNKKLIPTCRCIYKKDRYGIQGNIRIRQRRTSTEIHADIAFLSISRLVERHVSGRGLKITKLL